MRSPAKCGAWLLPLLITGCIFHKTKPLPAPLLAPSIEPSLPLELTSLELPPSQSVIAARPIYNMKEEAVPIRQPARHHKPVSKPEEVTDASAAAPPVVNAIGQGGLTSPDPASSRHQTEDSIATIEHGLNGINRPLNDAEQKTAGQIREFLKQAKAALATGDTDGAHTLTEKAKALLAELTK
jgi:hypothetical protein